MKTALSSPPCLVGPRTTAEARIALKAYDQVRRPRTQRIVESSRETGLILAGFKQETELNLDTLKERILPRWDFIVGFDTAKHRDEAVAIMDQELRCSQDI